MATKTKRIVDNREGQIEEDVVLRWFAVCELHNSLIGCYTKKEAQEIATWEFCEECWSAKVGA